MRFQQFVNVVVSIVIAISAGLIVREVNPMLRVDVCDEATIDAALTGGDVILSECDLTLTSTKVVTGSVTITGGVFRSSDLTLFEVADGGHLTLGDVLLQTHHIPLLSHPNAEITLHNVVINGGAKPVVNHGTLVGMDTLFQNFHCHAPCSGAAIMNIGNATFMRSVFRNNTISAPDDWREQRLSVTGGAIYNQGRLVLAHSQLRDNTAPFGGAIDNHGFMLIQDSSFTGNRSVGEQTGAGAILNRGRAIIQRVRFTENVGVMTGGALLNRGGDVTVSDSIFTDNTCITQDCTNNTFFNLGGDVDARFNYWGQATGPTSAMTNLRSRQYAPYLAELPSWAQ